MNNCKFCKGQFEWNDLCKWTSFFAAQYKQNKNIL